MLHHGPQVHGLSHGHKENPKKTMRPCRLEKPLSLAIAIYSTIDKEYNYIIEKNPGSIRPPSLLFTLG
jgi:hypothetical protein